MTYYSEWIRYQCVFKNGHRQHKNQHEKNLVLLLTRAKRTLPWDWVKRTVFICRDSERDTSAQNSSHMESLGISLHRIQRQCSTPQTQNLVSSKSSQNCRNYTRMSNVKRRSAGRVQKRELHSRDRSKLCQQDGLRWQCTGTLDEHSMWIQWANVSKSFLESFQVEFECRSLSERSFRGILVIIRDKRTCFS